MTWRRMQWRARLDQWVRTDISGACMRTWGLDREQECLLALSLKLGRMSTDLKPSPGRTSTGGKGRPGTQVRGFDVCAWQPCRLRHGHFRSCIVVLIKLPCEYLMTQPGALPYQQARRMWRCRRGACLFYYSKVYTSSPLCWDCISIRLKAFQRPDGEFNKTDVL